MGCIESHRATNSTNRIGIQMSQAAVHYDPTVRKSEEQIQINNEHETNMETLTKSYAKLSNSSGSRSYSYNVNDMTFTSSTESVVRVEIADHEDSINVTTNALRKCKKEVLRPYWRLLTFIGWRRFGQESVNAGSRGWQTLNFFYMTCIIILLLYTYLYSMVACQWKLNIAEDTHLGVSKPPSPQGHNHTGMNITTLMKHLKLNHTGEGEGLEDHSLYHVAACSHLISTYTIPNLLHFVAFILGFYHFRYRDNEQLYALMETVFLQASQLHSTSASQQKVIFRLRLYLGLSAIWIIFVIAEDLLFQWAYRFPKLDFFVAVGKKQRIILLSVQVFGMLVWNSVMVAVVLNFITQCEMIIVYIKGIMQRFLERATDLKVAMKDIFILRQNISALNGPMSKMTTLVSLISGGATIVAAIIVCVNENNDPLVWIYRSFFLLLFAIILIIPLMQAARANNKCRNIVRLALEARVFGYKTASQLELDSFVLFVSSAKLRVRIFHIPVTSSHIVGAAIIISFTLIILFQTNVIGTSI